MRSPSPKIAKHDSTVQCPDFEKNISWDWREDECINAQIVA